MIKPRNETCLWHLTLITNDHSWTVRSPSVLIFLPRSRIFTLLVEVFRPVDKCPVPESHNQNTAIVYVQQLALCCASRCSVSLSLPRKLCVHQHMFCQQNNARITQLIFTQETQLSLTNRTTRLEVSQGHQTWYHSIC